MRERIRVLEGLGDVPEIELPAPVAVDVPRAVSRLASGYRWGSPSDRTAFEACASTATGACLNATQPVGESP